MAEKLDQTLYEVLGVVRTATHREIQKAYYRLSLIHHPDKCGGLSKHQQGEAKTRFQAIGKAYSVLGNDESRRIYDATGQIHGEDYADWRTYFETQISRVTMEELEKYKRAYQGTEEEKTDLTMLYSKYRGDFDQISEHLFFYDVDQEQRYVEIIQKEIEAKRVKHHRGFEKSIRNFPKRIKKAQKEQREAQKLAKKLGIESAEDLALKIRGSRENNGLANKIASKYLRGQDIPPDPLSDEEFRRLQKSTVNKL